MLGILEQYIRHLEEKQYAVYHCEIRLRRDARGTFTGVYSLLMAMKNNDGVKSAFQSVITRVEDGRFFYKMRVVSVAVKNELIDNFLQEFTAIEAIISIINSPTKEKTKAESTVTYLDLEEVTDYWREHCTDDKNQQPSILSVN